jgi:putative oxidoreductase
VKTLRTGCELGEKMGPMGLIRTLTRAAVAGPFVSLGWDAFLEPGDRPVKVAALGVPHPDLAVTLNGAGMVLAGVALAAGVAPRLSAAVLAGLLVPTTLAGHAFWTETDPAARARQRIHLIKNLCMLGGLGEIVLSGRRKTKDDS